MYKVMIVDDEPAIRKGLNNFIDWESHGCSISAVATDGVDAVEKLEKELPDIIVTDIRMPEMDGIELSRYVYERYPHIKTVILTAYDDFEYSQAAIRYGVVDFVLKLTSTSKIIEAIEKAKSMITRERENAARIKTLETELYDQTKEIQEHLLLNLIKRIETDYKKTVKRMELLDMKLSRHCAAVLLLDDDCTSSMHSLKCLVSSMLAEFVHYNAAVNSNQLCIFIELKASDEYPDDIPKIFSIFSEMVYIIGNLEKTEANIGISLVHENISEAAAAYDEAMLALTDRFYSKAKVHSHSNRTDASLNSHWELLQKHFNRILEPVRQGMASEAASGLSHMFEDFKSIYLPIETIKSLSLQLLVAINGLAPLNINSDIIPPASCDDRYLRIWSGKSAYDIHAVLLNSIENTIAALSGSTITNNTIIKNIEKYILGNYMKDIDLPTIANHIHMNSSYLSRLYKKETGINISDKISGIRMEKAKELLLHTDLKIYEVAEQVGIKNPTYFSILFKKYTGMYPNSYKSSRK